MKTQRIGKTCGVIAILAPLWMYLLQQLYNTMKFNSEIYIFLCICIAVVCFLALIVSIDIDMKALKEKPINKRNKTYVYIALTLGIIIFAIIWLSQEFMA